MKSSIKLSIISTKLLCLSSLVGLLALSSAVYAEPTPAAANSDPAPAQVKKNSNMQQAANNKIRNSILATKTILAQQACYAFLQQNSGLKILAADRQLRESICGLPINSKLQAPVARSVSDKLQNLVKQSAGLVTAERLSIKDFNAACIEYQRQTGGVALSAPDEYYPVVSLLAPADADPQLLGNYQQANSGYQQLNSNLAKFFVIKNKQIQCSADKNGQGAGDSGRGNIGLGNLAGSGAQGAQTSGRGMGEGDGSDDKQANLDKRDKAKKAIDNGSNQFGDAGNGGYAGESSNSNSSNQIDKTPLPTPGNGGGGMPGDLPGGGTPGDGNKTPGDQYPPGTDIPSKPGDNKPPLTPPPDGGKNPIDPSRPVPVPVDIKEPPHLAFIQSVPDPADPFATKKLDGCVGERGVCANVSEFWNKYQEGRNERYMQPFAQRANYNQLWLETNGQ